MNETAFLITAKSSEFIVLVLLSCVSAMMAIVGNAVVLTAIYRTKALHTISNFFIASLAAADLAVGVVLNPLLAYKSIVFSYLNPERRLEGSVFNTAEDFAWIQAVVATTFGLTAISVDRYIAVNFGLRYSELSSRKKCLIATISVWVVSVIFASVRIFTKEPQHLSILWLVMAVVTCIIPGIVITFCYWSILKAARIQVRKIARQNTIRRAGEVSSAWRDNNALISQRKSAFTVAIVILLFIFLWSPSLVTAAIQLRISGSENPEDKRTFVILERRVWLWVCLVAYFSSAINPWVYSIRSTQFRTACKIIFKRPNLLRFTKAHVVDEIVQLPSTHR
ncbi:trace amine-associated receptor 9-like [Montipora capricornis]|uniref:trace amine-associated receptor 9-like n=1 Tax=Montipora capricornis TaxID=246305 RepID=UPI0035F18115